jgi:2-phosphoglycerate kinase
MIIFIGGPPRAGKSILAKKLVKSHRVSLIPTDSLRQGAIALQGVSKNSSLFAVISKGEWESPEKYYSQYSTKEAVKFQNQESGQVAKLVKGFVESIDYQDLDNYVFEGVALMPQFFSKEFLERYGINFFCVGNTNVDQFLKYSWKNRSPGDWLEKESFETFKKVIKYSVEFSKQIKKQCQKNNIDYFEIDSTNFLDSIDQAILKIEKNI